MTLPFPMGGYHDEEGLELPQKEDDMFAVARPGDAAMVPFQCDYCHFRNVMGRNPVLGNRADDESLWLIRRANLDAFWSRTSNTVATNLRNLQNFKQIGGQLGLNLLPETGPFPLRDDFGMGVAMIVLKKSLQPGRNGKFVQFNTVRRLRTAYGNFWRASVESPTSALVSSMEDGKKFVASDCPTDSFWYSRFTRGLHERVGDLIIQDLAISKDVMLEIMLIIERRLVENPNDTRNIELGYFCLVSWLAALRGNEVMYSNLGETNKLLELAKGNRAAPHAPLVLQGKFKNSKAETKYIFVLSCETSSNFPANILTWTERICKLRRSEGRESGWIYAYKEGPKKGKQLPMTFLEENLMEVLDEIQEARSDLIPRDLDIREEYGVFRSFRRGATTEAGNKRVRKSTIELNNSWRKQEASRGKHVTADMVTYYTEIMLAKDARLEFSRAL